MAVWIGGWIDFQIRKIKRKKLTGVAGFYTPTATASIQEFQPDELTGLVFDDAAGSIAPLLVSLSEVS